MGVDPYLFKKKLNKSKIPTIFDFFNSRLSIKLKKNRTNWTLIFG